GRKWASIAAGGPEVGDRYVVANGAEGEPGTFKDRMLMRRNPYQVIEGIAIAATTVGAVGAYIAVKASFEPEIAALERALSEMTGTQLIGDVPVTLVTGPDEYLFGEEKGLLEVIEGEDPLPRLFPPYVYGLFTTSPQMGWSAGVDLSADGPALPSSNPTLVNNVETLATVVPVLGHGPEWYPKMGTPESPGVVLCTVVGDTQHAGVAEVEMGTPLTEVIERVGGGPKPGRSVKAVLSGVANGVVTGDHLDAPVSYEGLEAVGGGLGAAGFIVYDDTADMIAVARAVSRFLYVESCGQCPPCKFGTGAITAVLDKVLAGEATVRDVEIMAARLETVTDSNRCYLPVQEQLVVRSILRVFAHELDAYVSGGGAARGDTVEVPKLADLRDGVAVIDERQARKQPDWTYAAS
ncbi:MAG TPA: NADH-ubiquinone oxidoreductase-F iron-sulfur binding region domain-containing protein, partial [Acidimicrobiia bacterium]|nr:NADH-ubiquinone oxidoreductase-F iron-sulfur binding region domain-containing protein [Acidimicrobiia bacterium]